MYERLINSHEQVIRPILVVVQAQLRSYLAIFRTSTKCFDLLFFYFFFLNNIICVAAAFLQSHAEFPLVRSQHMLCNRKNHGEKNDTFHAVKICKYTLLVRYTSKL